MSEVFLKSAQSLSKVVYVKFWSLKSKVCLKSVRSLSKVWIPKSVRSPKYYAQSLTFEDRILKSKIATKI